MPKVIILGTSNAVATEMHDNTHMVIVGHERTVLVDCVNSPLVRLEKARVDFRRLTDLLLTHFHPDHVSGVPLLLMDMWLMGRKDPLNIFGLQHTLQRIQGLMDFYGWSQWPGFYPVSFQEVSPTEKNLVLECAEFRLLSSPVRHLIPTIGIRVESQLSANVLAYSGDTEPCAEVVRLAAGADVLIHEAAGQGRGHSSASQAAEIATQAEVGRLLLIHYPTGANAGGDPVLEARERFQGDVALAEDFMTLEMEHPEKKPSEKD